MTGKRHVDVVVSRQTLPEVVARSAQESGSLFVPGAGLRAGETVDLCLRFEGFPQEFSVPGVVTAVRSRGRGPALPSGATLRVDPAHHGRLEKILAFARGEQVAWVKRDMPRYPVDLPVELRCAAGTLTCRTRDVSLGGVGLSATGALPAIGEEVEVRIPLAGSLLPLKLTGKVMWLDFFSATRGLGLRVVGGGFAWRRRLEKLVAAAAAGAGAGGA